MDHKIERLWVCRNTLNSTKKAMKLYRANTLFSLALDSDILYLAEDSIHRGVSNFWNMIYVGYSESHTIYSL